MNIYGWFPLGSTGLISLLSKWLSRVFSSTTIWNTSSLALSLLWASLVAQMRKNLAAMWEPWIWSLDWENPLEKGVATHSSTLAWRIPWTEEPGWLQSMGSQRVGHDWVTFTHSAFFMVQLSHPYMTTGKTKALTIRTFVSKVMSLLFNTLSGFLIAFLSRSKSLLVSWLLSNCGAGVDSWESLGLQGDQTSQS